MSRFVTDFGTAGTPSADGRLDAPAFHRNWRPIWSVLAAFMQNKSGNVLEVGSGTGQHIVEFARNAPNIVWWPSDYSETHRASIAAWRLHAKLANLRPPACIDLSNPDWDLPPELGPPRELLGIFCANVLHIAPWRVAEGLFAGAGGTCGPMDAYTCTDRSCGTDSTPRRAMPRSTPACEARMPNGACATPGILRDWLPATACI